jgi:hypothetical protein
MPKTGIGKERSFSMHRQGDKNSPSRERGRNVFKEANYFAKD